MANEEIKGKNKYKGYQTDNIKYAPGEKKELISAFENNDKDIILDIVFKIYLRGHFL